MKNHAHIQALEVQYQVNHSISVVSVEIFSKQSSNVVAMMKNILILMKLFRRMGPSGRTHSSGHDGGTQTQIHPGVNYDNKREAERKTGAGEVRVIVQPIQPVFYMPRQSKKIFEHFFAFMTFLVK